MQRTISAIMQVVTYCAVHDKAPLCNFAYNVTALFDYFIKCWSV